MNSALKHILRFVLFVLIQVLVLNQIEIGMGIQIMIYPLYVLLLPVEMGVYTLLLTAFGMGIAIDAMSDTYGLHTSSILAMAYFRPLIYQVFAPRDGYDPLLETNIYTMGNAWYLKTFGILLVIHHFWFFMLEMFKLNEILYVLQKTALSAMISFTICLLLQYVFLRKAKTQ